MRTFAECKKIYDMLYHADLEGMYGKEATVAFFRTKWLNILAMNIYPEYNKHIHQYHLSEEKKLMDGNYELEDCGDYLMQFSVLNGEAADYALCYMKNSPFWELIYDYAKIYNPDEYGYEVDETEMEMEEFLKGRLGSFLEDAFEEKEILGKELLDVYELYSTAETTDELCGIKTELYPFVKMAKEVAGEDCKEMILALEQAFLTVKGWLGINEVHFSTDKSGYFIVTDSSSDIMSGYPGYYGALDLDPAIIICGELIEAALFEIHDKYPFLPEEIVRRRMK